MRCPTPNDVDAYVRVNDCGAHATGLVDREFLAAHAIEWELDTEHGELVFLCEEHLRRVRPE